MTTEKVQEFLAGLKDEDGLSASSLNHYRTILNSIFNEAVRHGRYDTTPYARSINSASLLGATGS
jgi:site-specific recombinase XerC